MSICGIPFYRLTIQEDHGRFVFVPCCTSWNNPPYNKFSFVIPEDKDHVFDVDSAWNSIELKEFRRSILDGSYRYCNKDMCPFLISNILPPLPDKSLPYISDNETHLDYPPIQIAANIDTACNLSCPSCRSKKDRLSDPRTYPRLIGLLKSGTEGLFINSSGEVFANTYMLRLLREFSSKEYPNIKHFEIITNGTLLNKTMWFSLSEDFKRLLNKISISIDSSIEDTYNSIRPGGNFKNLIKNIEFIRSLRDSGIIESFHLLFVLQKKNIKEIETFSEFAVGLKPNAIEIKKISYWENYPISFFESELKLPISYRIHFKEIISRARKIIET